MGPAAPSTANLPEEDVGGGGLDTLDWMLMERGSGTPATRCRCTRWPAVAHPVGLQRLPSRRVPAADGGRRAHRVPGHDRTGGRLRPARHAHPRVPDGPDWVVTRTKHFISHADESDFVILFAATGEAAECSTAPAGGPRSPPSSSSADLRRGRRDGAARLPQRLAWLQGTRSWSWRGSGCRARRVLGKVSHGFEVANAWLGATRLQLAAGGLGRAAGAGLGRGHAAGRRQFGRTIGRTRASRSSSRT